MKQGHVIAVLEPGHRSHGDDTAKVAKELGCQVRTRSILKDAAWGKEAPARIELWNWACEVAGDGWLLINDADQVLMGDVRALTLSVELNAWSFILYDCWSETQYRSDGYWQAHTQPRVWMVRPSRFGSDYSPVWNTRGIHTGHYPANAPLMAGFAPPESYFWLHLGYMKPEDRVAKHQRYRAVAAQLSPQEIAHAESIVDPA